MEHGSKFRLSKFSPTVDNNIAKYGYAVIVIHPQDFVKVSNNGKFVNLVDINELKELSQLIDSILSKNIHITSFSKIVGIGLITSPLQSVKWSSYIVRELLFYSKSCETSIQINSHSKMVVG